MCAHSLPHCDAVCVSYLTVYLRSNFVPACVRGLTMHTFYLSDFVCGRVSVARLCIHLWLFLVSLSVCGPTECLSVV